MIGALLWSVDDEESSLIGLLAITLTLFSLRAEESEGLSDDFLRVWTLVFGASTEGEVFSWGDWPLLLVRPTIPIDSPF